ncbi:hypothetical protein [Sphingomonas sp. Leaf242]|uniref:hypothetical protein n=1 Tax=Sphingomonas sp. Leaf242 TaxID=1736304 RepID=UPI0007132052|nr:hypothetical protein [Sphingomonas sp. Leaf242]KQO09431.1 hypothetical protein ASF09_07345 [Sphingomonas sp. Leaf242]
MSGIEPGSLADWFSGTGGIIASIVAVAIALRQEGNSKRAERLADAQRIAGSARVKEEALRIIGDIEAQAGSYVQLNAFGGGDAPSKMRELKTEIDGLRSQLTALQNYPNLTPSVIAEIGRAVHDSRVDLGDLLSSSSGFAMQMRSLTEKMKKRRDALTNAQNSLL